MAGLVRDTKTILLHGGMQDSVDEFLVEAPNMLLVQNGVFRREGVISKRNGYDLIASSTNPGGTARSIFSDGSSYFTVGTEGLYSYTDGDWSLASAGSPVVATENVLRVPAKPGAQCFTQAKDSDYLYIAYEVHDDTAEQTTNIRLETYTLAGALVAYTTISDRQAPVLLASDDAVYLLYYDGDVRIYRVAAGTATTTYLTTAASAVVNTQLASAAYSDNINNRAQFYPHTVRDGFPQYNACLDENGYLYVQASGSAGSVKVERISPLGVSVATNTVTGALRPLSVHAFGGYVYSLYAECTYNGTSFVTEAAVSVRRILTSTMATSWTTVLHSANLTDILCGTVVGTFGSSCRVAFTTVGSRGNFININPATTTLQQISSGGAISYDFDVVGYRVASEGALVDGKFYLALEQGTPLVSGVANASSGYQGDASGDYNRQTSPLVLRKPKPAVVCEVSFSDETVSPIASFSPANGETVPVDDCAVIHRLCPLLVSSFTLYALSREVFEQADTYVNTNFDGSTRYRERLRFGQSGATVSSINLLGSPTLSASSAAAGVLLCAGTPLQFDGKSLQEITPLVGPEILGISLLEEGDPLTALGTQAPIFYEATTVDDALSFKAVYVFKDSFGRLHRSAPAFTTMVQKDYDDGILPVEWAAARVYVAPPLSFSRSDSGYSVEVYLKEDDVFKLAGSSAIPAGYTGTTAVFVHLGERDSGNLVRFGLTGKVLYTDSSEVSADGVPPFRHMCTSGGRVFGVYQNRIYYSKKVVDGVGPEFSPSFSKELVGVGSLIGISALDDKVVLFEKDKVHVLYGDGPSNTAQGQDFGILTLPSNVGCLETSSITGIPEGIVFRSRRGFFVLRRDLTLTYIGGPVVNSIQGAAVVAATDVPNRNEVRFILAAGDGDAIDSDGPTPDSTRPPTPDYGNGWASGYALCYNYGSDKWSMFTNHVGVAACVKDGKYAFLKSSWDVWEESTGYEDPTGDNLLKLVTSWTKLRNIQDYGQLWKATLLGRYLSTFVEDEAGDLDAGDIQVKVAYDYGNTDVDTKLWRASNELQPVERDSAVVSPGAMRLQVRPEKQKCSSVRFTIEETNTTDADGLTYRPGQGFEITSIDLELGMRPGTNTALPAKSKK